MSYYDANGDGRSLGGGDHVGGVIPHEVCSCGGALYLDRDSDAAALPCTKLGFRAKVCTTCGKVSTRVRRYKEVAQGEPGCGAWVPFVPSLLVCVNGRALRKIADVDGANGLEAGLNVTVPTASKGFA